MMSMSAVQQQLPCGIEFAALPLAQRHIVSFQIRMLGGASCDPEDRLGLARLVTETLDKGTAKRSGRELLDAFDAMGAMQRSGTGRETATFTCTVLPEHFEAAVELLAEMIRTPTFAEDAVAVNKELAKQELVALEDDAHSLADKLLAQQALGSPLGRHPLGERETLERLTRDDLHAHWQAHFAGGRMMVAVAGAIDPSVAADIFEREFTGFGAMARAGRDPYPCGFAPQMLHHEKDLEQEQIGVAWPGVDPTHADYPVQRVVLGILSGGMSGRLFTEVREKQGLVYWVGAWHETPRGSGVLCVGASTTPERCDQTYETLLREVDRLGEDVEADELERAVTGLVARHATRGDTTQARASELANDLFYWGRPIALEEKIAQLEAVTVEDVRTYLAKYPRDKRCVVTLGPRPLAV
jgi:predicted Zn-dependent peptidase